MQKDLNQFRQMIIPEFQGRTLLNYLNKTATITQDQEKFYLKGSFVTALADLRLRETEQYLYRLLSSSKIPAAPAGFLNNHSEFHQVMVDTAYDISKELGAVMDDLHARLSIKDVEALMKDPDILERHLNLGKYNILTPKEQDARADSMSKAWEFNMLSGTGFIMALARIRNGYSAQSPEYETSLLFMKDVLKERENAFLLKCFGNVLGWQRQTFDLSKLTEATWDGIYEKAHYNYRAMATPK